MKVVNRFLVEEHNKNVLQLNCRADDYNTADNCQQT